MKAAEEQRQREEEEEKRKAAEKKREEKRQEREVRFIFYGCSQKHQSKYKSGNTERDV